MTRIDSSAISALVRAQLISKTQNEAPKDHSLTKTNLPRPGGESALQSPAKPGDRQALGAQLALEQKWILRLQGIALDDPDRRRKAFRIFLESVLEKELGSAFQSTIQFSQVVEQVHQQIDGDPELHENSLLAGEALLQQLS